MKRLTGWRGRLHAHIEAARRLPFQYGSTDCASFAAGAVLAMTGQDHRSWAGQYATYAAGLRRVRESGWLDHIDYVSAHFDAIPVAQAAMGDLAAVPGEVEATIAVDPPAVATPDYPEMPHTCVSEEAFLEGCDMAIAGREWDSDRDDEDSDVNDMRAGFVRMREALEAAQRVAEAAHAAQVAAQIARKAPPTTSLALGVVGGAEVFVLRPDGLATVPLTAAKKAWRV